MTSQGLKKIKLPDEPGVYFFKNKKETLYIGKATSLKDRVKSYFNKDLILARGPRLTAMLEQATTVEWQETDSVLEALLLETALIKKHQPKYNAKEKDDKSYWHVVITREDFPQILQVRGKDLPKNGKNFTSSPHRGPTPIKFSSIFGPFPSGSELKEALKIIRRIFPYRDGKCRPNQGKPCFNRQIGLCPGVCTGEISKADYAKTIRNLKLLFNGKKGEVIKNLEREMKRLAKAKEFEQAAKARNQIFALNHIRDVALLKNLDARLPSGSRASSFRIEAYDIAHTSGKEVVGVMTVVLGGLSADEAGEPAPDQYRKFKLSQNKNDDTGNLREILERRLNHPEWPAPSLVVVDGGLTQLNAVKKVLSVAGVSWPVVAVTKDERHRAKNIIGEREKMAGYEGEVLLANSEAHRFALKYHRARRGKLV